MHIITTLDEVRVEDYLRLAGSLRQQRGELEGLTTVVLTGDVTAESADTLATHADRVESFREFEMYKQLHPHWKAIGHPLGKFAKLFFALEYIVSNNVDDVVVFLDPDTYVQRPLADFETLVIPGVLLFGHEMQHAHLAHRPSARLNVAKRFDKEGPWYATYYSEINTGVVLGRAEDYKSVIEAFQRFTLESDYFTKHMRQLKYDHWHDQDCFRYFLRKVMPMNVGVFDIDQVFTTTGGAARCLHRDPEHDAFVTSWDRLPYVVHFAGGTWATIMAEAPVADGSAQIVYEDETPWRRPFLHRHPLLLRILDTSPLDIARSVRNVVRSRLGSR